MYWEMREKKQRDPRRKAQHNTQGLHTMKRVMNSSPYAFIYMYGLGQALTTHMGQCHRCYLTLSFNNHDFIVLYVIFVLLHCCIQLV